MLLDVVPGKELGGVTLGLRFALPPQVSAAKHTEGYFHFSSSFPKSENPFLISFGYWKQVRMEVLRKSKVVQPYFQNARDTRIVILILYKRKSRGR